MGSIGEVAGAPEKNLLTRAVHHLVVAMVLLPFIYILSAGPAIVIVVKIPKLRAPIHTVYAPMIWLHDHTGLKNIMAPYLAFWETAARRL
jgi:hypothetical protein